MENEILNNNTVFGRIYLATNILNGLVYVGQTVCGLCERKANHFSKTKIKKRNEKFVNALRKYGKENFIWEEIDTAENEQELNDKEREYVWLYKANDRKFGYNIKDGGKNNGYIIDINEIVKLFKDGLTLLEIQEKTKHDRKHLANRLKSFLGKETYKEISRKNRKPKLIKKNISKEDLEKYLDGNYNLRQIGKFFNTDGSIIKNKVINFFGIEVFNQLKNNIIKKSKSDISKEQLENFINLKYSCKRMAKELSVDSDTIYNRIEYYFGVNFLEELKKKRHPENYFKVKIKKESLEDYINKNYYFCEIAEKFNVKVDTVVNRIKFYFGEEFYKNLVIKNLERRNNGTSNRSIIKNKKLGAI